MKRKLSDIIQKVVHHTIIWGLILFSPYLFLPELRESETGHFWYPVVRFMLVFYLNYIIFIDKLLFRKKYALFVILNVLIAVLCRYEWDIYHFLTGESAVKSFNHRREIASVAYKSNHLAYDFLTFFIPVIVSVGVKTFQYRMKEEVRRKEIENKNMEAELQHLKYQLQPHFVFNILNNIYSLIDTAPKTAGESLHKLSKLMRYMLYCTKKDNVTLAEEIDFIEKYIRLMQLKHDEKVKIDYRCSELHDKSYSIAPLLFVPLVENAFKHGVSTQDVSDISLEFSLSDNKLVFKSENSNHPKTSTDKSGSGTGLENLKKRLELIYPSRHTFHYGVSDGRFIAELQIKLENHG